MGLHALVALGPISVIGCAIAALVSFGVIPALVDGYLYYDARKPVSAVGNFLAYNALGQGGGGAGANLYGEEPWTFYPRNLLLNVSRITPHATWAVQQRCENVCARSSILLPRSAC